MVRLGAQDVSPAPGFVLAHVHTVLVIVVTGLVGGPHSVRHRLGRVKSSTVCPRQSAIRCLIVQADPGVLGGDAG